MLDFKVGFFGTALLAMAFLSLGAMGLIVTIATVVSFISAPVIAYISYQVMQGETIKKEDRPDKLMALWSKAGIAIMALLSLVYLWLIVVI